jgi:general secretion pathway protein L
MGPIETTLGIHVDEADLRIAVVQARFGTFRCLKSDKIEGFSQLPDEAKKSAVAALIKKMGLRRARAFLTVPRDMGVSRQVELPVEVGDRVESAVALQLESLSPWSSDEVFWGFSADRSGKNERSIKVAVAIVPRAVLQPISEAFRLAGVPLAGAGLSVMAEAHAFILCRKMTLDEARLFVFTRPVGPVIDQELASLPVQNSASADIQERRAIAAAMLGFGRSAFGVNLVPAPERYRLNHLRWVPTYALAALLVMLGIAAIFRAPYQWYVYASSLDSELEALKPAVAAVWAEEEKLTQATAAYNTLKARVDSRDSNLEALVELSRVLPPDCWISSYNAQGRTVTMSGFAQSASVVQKVLEESSIFEGVQFSSPVTRDQSGRDRFSLKASIGAAE